MGKNITNKNILMENILVGFSFLMRLYPCKSYALNHQTNFWRNKNRNIRGQLGAGYLFSKPHQPNRRNISYKIDKIKILNE